MTRKGGINKTRKAVAKRFKVTGTGKVLRRKQGKRHILQKKSSKRKRQLGRWLWWTRRKSGQSSRTCLSPKPRKRSTNAELSPR